LEQKDQVFHWEIVDIDYLAAIDQGIPSTTQVTALLNSACY
jgi:hypothetical protein